MICLAAVALGALAAPANALIKGSLTLKVSGTPSDAAGSASGKIDTKKICGAFREIKLKLLNPPKGYPQPSSEYGTPNGKRYSISFLVPFEPGTYEFRAIAKRTRVARGLKRAKCAKMKSPVVELVVEPPIE
jgi:hypothetical protein